MAARQSEQGPAAETEETPEAEARRLQANLDEENEGIALYRVLAEAEPQPERRRIFERLSTVERRHADVWRQRLRELGVEPIERGPNVKLRLIGVLARRFGVRSVLPIVRAMEASAYATYMAQDRTGRRMAPEEMEHQVTIDRMERKGPPASSGEAVRESWHRTGGGGVLRATVFGINDGLVSNASLVMGFAGAQVAPSVVLLAGMAGLMAGAFSMAVGEYVSMRAQRDLFRHQIEIEERELAESPAEEEQELAAIYRAKGLTEDQARSLAGRLTRDPDVALDVLIREELGLDPSQLGSAWGAAAGSFIAFAVGALVPVLPFLFAKGTALPLIVLSAGLSGLTLFVVGALLTLFTGTNPIVSGLRQLLLGSAAATVTFLLGSLLGRSIGL